MERYCSSLQPSIRSRRYPYASLNRYILDSTRLAQIKLRYNLASKLCLKAPSLHGLYRAVCIPGCTYTHTDWSAVLLITLCPTVTSDHTCALLPPHSTSVVLTAGLRNKLTGALCTYLKTTLPTTRTALAASTVEEWGGVRVFDDGDMIRAADFNSHGSGASSKAERDLTFVRVRSS